MSQCILVLGNLSDGFTFVGPFDDCDEATQYVTDERVEEDNWVATLDSTGQEDELPQAGQFRHMKKAVGPFRNLSPRIVKDIDSDDIDKVRGLLKEAYCLLVEVQAASHVEREDE